MGAAKGSSPEKRASDRNSRTLSFSAPDRFARHTLQPTKESMEVQGRTLILRRGNRTRQMEMDSIPEVAALLDAMRATLTGDAAVLKKLFRIELSGSDAKWVLRLSPREFAGLHLRGIALFQLGRVPQAWWRS